MPRGVSEPLGKFLRNSSYALGSYGERRVVVVGVVGKEGGLHSKTDSINALLGNNIFEPFPFSLTSDSSVDAFFCTDLSTVFLRLRGYGDVSALQAQFSSGDDEKGFFDCLADAEQKYLRDLIFLLSVCHAILFVEPSCRFDMNIGRMLKRAYHLWNAAGDMFSERLSWIPKLPRDWLSETRLAKTRLLFALHRSPFRADLGAVKRRELLSKLEQSIEAQIYNLLKLHKLIGNSNKKLNYVSVPPKSVPFVYIFSARECPQDVIKEMLLFMLQKSENGDVDDEKKKKSCSDDFQSFMRMHMDEIRRDRERTIFYEIPKLKWFLEGGKAVYEMLFEEKIISDEALADTVNFELLFTKSISPSYIAQAKGTYQYRDTRDLEKRKPFVYNRSEHEAKLALAMERLEGIYHGTELESAKEELRKECEEIWETQKACEEVSLTGNPCTLPMHFSPRNLDAPSSKRILHSNAITFLCACSCGRSQSLRNDPFTLKDANFDFFMRAQFSCCRRLESYEFSLFRKDDLKDVTFSESESWSDSFIETADREEDEALSHENQEVSNGEEERFFTNLFSQDDTLNILLERNIQSPRDILGPTDASFPSKEELSLPTTSDDDAHSSDGDYDRADLEGSADSEDDVPEPKSATPGERRTLAHMDEEETSSEDENEPVESASKSTCYLDEELVVFHEGDPDKIENSRKIEVDGEEELAHLRKSCKGLFLECVPNSDCPPRLPLFPSWSLLCIGHSSIYSHKAGLRDMPNLRSGSNFLLPVDVYLNVDGEKWEADMKEIMNESTSHRCRRKHKSGSSNREKVKLFIGFEYECPRGHRFMIQDAKTPMREGPANSKEGGMTLLRSELPVWMPCSYRHAPQVAAQLMRLHVVTPKAPVTVTVNPVVRPSSACETAFYTGESPIALEWAKYYVLRFPYVYGGPRGIFHRPKEATYLGKVEPNCIQVEYHPSSHND